MSKIVELANAIDDLCSPNDNYGWASAGIYCFWDYYAEAILYIGLASDLAVRFKQHNGIIPLESGSKQKQIEEYFSNVLGVIDINGVDYKVEVNISRIGEDETTTMVNFQFDDGTWGEKTITSGEYSFTFNYVEA